MWIQGLSSNLCSPVLQKSSNDVLSVFLQMQILHVMSFLVERMTLHIRPHAAILVQYLPSLWQESEDHNMLRCAILTTLTNLVQVSLTCIHLGTTFLQNSCVLGSGSREFIYPVFPGAPHPCQHWCLSATTRLFMWGWLNSLADCAPVLPSSHPRSAQSLLKHASVAGWVESPPLSNPFFNIHHDVLLPVRTGRGYFTHLHQNHWSLLVPQCKRVPPCKFLFFFFTLISISCTVHQALHCG